jgi:hypothetical protein
VPARLTKNDDQLLRYLVDFYYLKPSQLAELVGRPRRKVQQRLRMLRSGRVRDGKFVEGLSLTRSLPQPFSRFGEEVWYLTQSAWDYAYEAKGWISELVHANDEKSVMKLPHDLLISDYHMLLYRTFGEKLIWSQHRYVVYERFGPAPDDKIYADAFFYLDNATSFPSFFLEIENSAENKYDSEGRSSRVRKCESYVKFLESGAFEEKFRYPDFRVILLVPSPREARNFAAKLHKLGGALDSSKFWITDFERAFSSDPYGYITPKDYEQRTYSLDDVQQLSEGA